MTAAASTPNTASRSGPIGLGALVLGLFFFSGACGLMYEIIWMRDLRLVMGNTVFSTTTVLCAFMGGLALGSYVGGRIIDRRRDPLRIYALMEGTIGLYCLFFPLLLGSAEPIYRLAYEHFEGSFYLLSMIRFFFSGLILLVPTTLMGATLPILGKFFIRQPHRIAWRIGRLYALNTFGAVLGAAMAGLFLLPAIGVSNTLHVACAVNLLVSAAALLLHYRWRDAGAELAEPADAAAPVAGKPARPTGDVRSPNLIRFLLIGYGLSGFAAMVYEVAWTRVLSLVMGSTVYAFSLMLISFILGLAVGSIAYSWFLDGRKHPVFTLAMIEVGIGLSALAVVPVLGQLPLWIVPVINSYSKSFFMVQLAEFGIIFALMLIPTTLMGAAFPLASRIYAEGASTIGRSIGNLYASNTVGSIFGSALAGFVLVPLLGIEKTAISAALLNVALGCGFLAFVSHWRSAYRAVAAVVLLGIAASAFAWLPTWDTKVMSSGPFRNFADMAKAGMQPEASSVLFHEEGLGTTVTIRQSGKTLTLTINGKADASNGDDMDTQELIAHLPLLLHKDPKNALVVGLGSGITLGSASRYPLDSVDCVELCPPVIHASRFFNKDNYNVLTDPRVRLIMEDGRNHLLLTQRRYDVIISEPTNPYIAGVADLFTKEYYELCRSRLRPGGVLCAWVQTYNMKPEAFLSVVRTFHSVFPHTTMWRSRWVDCMLVGTLEPLRLDIALLEERMALPAVAADMARIRIKSPADLLANLALREDAIAEFAGDAPIHTDDNAMLEFAAPLGLYGRSDTSLALAGRFEPLCTRPIDFLTAGPQDQARLQQLQQTGGRFMRARQLSLLGMLWPLDKALVAWRTAAQLNPRDAGLRGEVVAWLLSEAKRMLDSRAYAKARPLVELVLSIDPADPESSALMADILVAEGKEDEAQKQLAQSVELAPDSFMAHFQYATWLRQKGDPTLALSHFLKAAQLEASRSDVQAAIGELLLLQKQPAQAVPYLARACELAPDDIALRARYAQSLDASGMERQALDQYRLLLGHRPDSIEFLNNVAWLQAVSGDAQVRNAQEAIKLVEKLPQSPVIIDTLAAAYAQAGRFSDAAAAAERGLALANQAGMTDLAREIDSRLQLYRSGKPYIRQ